MLLLERVDVRRGCPETRGRPSSNKHGGRRAHAATNYVCPCVASCVSVFVSVCVSCVVSVCVCVVCHVCCMCVPACILQAKDKLKNEYKDEMSINDALKLTAHVLAKTMDVRAHMSPGRQSYCAACARVSWR